MPRAIPSFAPPLPTTLVVAVVLAVGGIGCRKPPPAPPPPASEVAFTMPRPMRVPEYLEVTGRIDAEFVVDIRSRITGYLTKVTFRDGQFVAKGDPLYEIDERPYTAQLAAAAGEVEQLIGQQKFLMLFFMMTAEFDQICRVAPGTRIGGQNKILDRSKKRI